MFINILLPVGYFFTHVQSLGLPFIQLTSSAGEILLKKRMSLLCTFAVVQSEKGCCSCWRLGFDSDDGRASWETTKSNAQVWVWSVEYNWIFIVTGFLVGCNVCTSTTISKCGSSVYEVLSTSLLSLFSSLACFPAAFWKVLFLK